MFSLFLNKYHIEFCIPKTMTNNFCMQHVSSYSRYYMTFATKKEKNRLLATRSFLQSRVEIHCVRFHRFHLEVVNTQNLKKKKTTILGGFFHPLKKYLPVKLDHFQRVSGRKSKMIEKLPPRQLPPHLCFSLLNP